MKKDLTFMLFKFFNHAKTEFLRIGLFLLLYSLSGYSGSISSRQFLRSDRSLLSTKLEKRKHNQLFSKTSISQSSTLKSDSCIYSYSLFSVSEASFFTLIFPGLNKFLIPDTISRAGEDKYIKSLSEDKFKGGRTARWYFAWVIFKHYSLHKKLFGGGFDYLEMFGKEFGEAEYDYPHNPFISAFLYSGIIGGLLYILFMIVVFYQYIKYLRYHIFFFICFLVVFFFSFVSANTHFSIPIFAFFSFVPFLTKYLVDKESLQNLKNQTH